MLLFLGAPCFQGRPNDAMTSMRVNRRLEELSGFHLGLLQYFLQKGWKRVQNGSVFPQNASQIGVNENAEVKMITVASRRHNPSSISDSKGGVYKRMFFFSPPHPQRVCEMIPASD